MGCVLWWLQGGTGLLYSCFLWSAAILLQEYPINQGAGTRCQRTAGRRQQTTRRRRQPQHVAKKRQRSIDRYGGPLPFIDHFG